jgi:hypothetical protein
MNLELLPNEIFLVIFDYFDSIDLLHAFYNLNYRFNCLLHKLFRYYCFKFRVMSKRNFDMICQQHLPFIADRVITLHLSNGGETPEQINLLYSYISSFNQFTQLRSLKLFSIKSFEGLLKILYECRYLNHLTHLKLHNLSFRNDQIDLQSVVDNIWSLPKLTNCSFSIEIENQRHFCIPRIISSSLECVTLFRQKFGMKQINQLLEYTPRLKRLSDCVLTPINDNYLASPLSTLIQLKISFYSDDATTLTIVLQNVPHLCHLDINILTNYIDGHKWEKIIRNYLPKLKTFRLKSKTLFFDEPNLEERAEELINSFRSSFWIKEHQWFFRCFIDRIVIHLYTLSEPLDYHSENIGKKCKLSCPQEDYQQVFNNTTFIHDNKFFNRSIPSHIRFPNIQHLDIKFPIHGKFWSIVPTLNRLCSLDISSYADNYQVQLQTLLNLASNLDTLTIYDDESLPLQLSFFKCINASLRRIYLRYRSNHFFNNEECIAISRSPLCVKCEVLSIGVNKPESIIFLVKKMSNLRSLYIYWNGKKTSKQLSLTTNSDVSYDKNSLNTDQLIQWLQIRLPSTCLIAKDPDRANRITIWI